MITIGDKLVIRKVTSHAGVPGNMTADIIAGMERVNSKAVKKFIVDKTRYSLHDADGYRMVGNVYKMVRNAYQGEWLNRWAAQKEQGAWVRNLMSKEGKAPWEKDRMSKVWDGIRKSYINMKWTTEVITNTLEWEEDEAARDQAMKEAASEMSEEDIRELTDEERQELEEYMKEINKERAQEARKKKEEEVSENEGVPPMWAKGNKKYAYVHMQVCRFERGDGGGKRRHA